MEPIKVIIYIRLYVERPSAKERACQELIHIVKSMNSFRLGNIYIFDYLSAEPTPLIRKQGMILSPKEIQSQMETFDLKNKKYQVQFTTSMGVILLDLFPDVAEGHCRNILALAKTGFYDGLGFHRVIDGFVIQGGCPKGNGTGGPGYNIKAEFNPRPHNAGTLSMARSMDPDSAGSQFFLCLGRVPHLDNQYTVFGEAANKESRDIILAIGKVETSAGDRPKVAVNIEKAVVIESAI